MAAETVVIFGAFGSLGSELADYARSQGHRLILFDKDPPPASDVLDCDLADEASTVEALRNIPINADCRYRILFTAATYNGSGDSETAPWEQVAKSLQINLLSQCHIALAMAQAMVGRGICGRIVLTSSAAARVGSCDIGYGVAKAGLEGLVRSLSKAFARYGITTIGVSPGVFPSAMSEAQSPERRAAAVESTHIKRHMELAEVADTVRFALFAAPDAMTGSILPVSGGQ
jgi:NAD(P)-dependent dehydrogenase (short-subunit alcohol dehydrogenase family)